MLTSNTHFTIGVHVLAALAVHEGHPVPSSDLARSVSTNPAFLRAVMGSLREAGLVETQRGKGGGALIGRDPAHITLLDIYRATEGEARLQAHDCSGADCALGQAMPSVLKDISARLDHVVAQELSRITVAEIAERVRPR